jgi:hypothetical protein
MEIVFLRFKKEEVKIEAWESRQRGKIESEMRRIEVLTLLLKNGLYLAFSAYNSYSKFECNDLSYDVFNGTILHTMIF